MVRKLVVLAVAAAIFGLGVFWVVTIPATVPASALGQRAPNLDNGRVMFFAGGCASCHATPGQDDKTKLGGGLGLKSPFGTFYVPNISPDPREGIGRWSEADFVTAMIKGTSPDGRHYWPAIGAKDIHTVLPIKEHQFRQTAPGTLEVLLVTASDILPEHEAAIRTIVSRVLPAKFDIQIRRIDAIPRPASGKHEEFVSLLA